MSHGSGPYHGKDANPSTIARRRRSWLRCRAKKDRNVRRSSKGKFKTVADLERHHRQQKPHLPAYVPPVLRDKKRTSNKSGRKQKGKE
jgi:hypothetical protein